MVLKFDWRAVVHTRADAISCIYLYNSFALVRDSPIFSMPNDVKCAWTLLPIGEIREFAEFDFVSPEVFPEEHAVILAVL